MLSASHPLIPILTVDLNSGSFHMVLNNGTDTEEALREILIEHGLIKVNDLSLNPIIDTSQLEEISFHHFSLELATGRQLETSRKTFITGMPGTGKSYFIAKLAHLSSKMGDTVVVVNGSKDTYISQFSEDDTSNIHTTSFHDNNGLLGGMLNPFDIYQINKEHGRKIIMETLLILCNYQKIIFAHKDIINDAIDIVGRKPQASIDLLIQHFMRSDYPVLRSLSEQLKSIRTVTNADILCTTRKDKFDSHIMANQINVFNLELQHADFDPYYKTVSENINGAITTLLLEFITLYNMKNTPTTVFIDEVNDPIVTNSFVSRNPFVHVGSSYTHKIQENIYDNIAMFNSTSENLQGVTELLSTHINIVKNLPRGKALLKTKEQYKIIQ